MKSKRGVGFIFVFSAAVLFAAAASISGQGYGERNRPGDGGSVAITGKVTMPDGSPAVGVKVSLSSADVNNSTFTDADGNYFFSSVPGGNYTVSVKVEGLPLESESYNIDQDTAGGKNITLPLYLRNPGQKKGDYITGNPLFKDVPKNATDIYKKAFDKLHGNDPKGSIALFDEAIAAYPNFAAAYFQRGTAYLKQNDLDKALESFVKAIQIKPDYFEAKYSYGLTEYLKNNFDIAAAVFDDVLKQKEMAEAHMYLGVSLVKLRNADAAIPHLKAAIAARDDASTAIAHRTLAAVYMQKKQNAEAAAELEKYLTLVPKAPDADKLRSAIADLKKTS